MRLDNGQPGLNVALAALRGGSPHVALQVTEGVLSQRPDDVRALVVQGDALTALGRFNDANTSYSKALTLDRSSVGAHIGLGRIRLGSNPAQAELQFVEALQHNPRNTTALNDLGIARDLLGHHAAAQKAYARALGISPDLHAAQVNMALSLAMSGETGRAVRLLKPMASTSGASTKLRHDLAAVLAMAGDRAAAARILSRTLSPAEVQQALQAYVSARSGAAPTPLLAGSASGGPATPAPPRPHHPATPAPAAQASGASGGPQTPAPPPPHHPAKPATPVVQASGASGGPQTPAPPPPHHPAKPAAPVVQASGASGGPGKPSASGHTPFASGLEVQFSASPSEATAQAEWRRLLQHMPALMKGRQPDIMKVEREGQTFWRVRTSGFTNLAAADAYCQQVQAAGNPCVVARR